MQEIKRILVLAPHTDDGELGCGATIAKCIRKGKEIYYVAFSTCDESLPDELPKGTLKKELFDAMACLGVPCEKVIVFDFLVRNFPNNRQAILEEMVSLNKTIKPDLVYMPSINDIHQDHFTIATEGMRAFKKTNILCYELPWNNYTFNNQAFSCLEEIDVKKRIDAVKCYQSQQHRDYAGEDFTRGLLKSHGVQIGVEYAEVFEVPRWILK